MQVMVATEGVCDEVLDAAAKLGYPGGAGVCGDGVCGGPLAGEAGGEELEVCVLLNLQAGAAGEE